MASLQLMLPGACKPRDSPFITFLLPPQAAAFLSLLHPREAAGGTLRSASMVPATPASMPPITAMLSGDGETTSGPTATRVAEQTPHHSRTAALGSFPHPGFQKDTMTHSFSTGSIANAWNT